MIRSLYGSMARNLAQVFGARSVSKRAMNSKRAALMRMRSMICPPVPDARLVQIDQNVEQDARRDVGILHRHDLERAMADAAVAATDEQHADGGDAGEHFGV